ncbi:MAG: hypothetical protein ACP5IX_00635, partial [Patescibacteria group bacterium]
TSTMPPNTSGTSLVMAILSRVNVFKSLCLEILTLPRIVLVECSKTNSTTTCFNNLSEMLTKLVLGVKIQRQFLHLKRPSLVFQNLDLKHLGHFILNRPIEKLYHIWSDFGTLP